MLRQAFRWHFARELEARGWEVDPVVWTKDWGVNIKPFGNGANAIKYLGTYVCRSVIADSRIVAVEADSVTFRWKDRSDHDRIKTDTIPGVEFVNRYLRHVLPLKMRAIRYFGFCHPAAKAKRERIAFHTGIPLKVGAAIEESTATTDTNAEKPGSAWPTCPCCRRPMERIAEIAPVPYAINRAPPLASPSSLPNATSAAVALAMRT